MRTIIINIYIVHLKGEVKIGEFKDKWGKKSKTSGAHQEQKGLNEARYLFKSN